MLSQLLSFFKALNSDAGPWQMAFAGGFALIIGLTPLWSVHNLIVLLLVFVLRTHIGTFFVFWAIFSGFAYLLDPWFDQLGYAWLTQPGWQSFWTSLYQNDWWQVARFNHTVTLGSLAVSLVLFAPVVVALRFSVVKYRAKWMPLMNKLKVVQALKATRLYDLYSKVN